MSTLSFIVLCVLVAQIFAQEGREPKIWGGTQVEGPKYYQVGIKKGDFVCTGVLLHSRWVLTSAACATHSTQPEVIFGVNEIPADWAGSIYVKETIVHPAYNPTYLINDIALLELTADVPTAGTSLVTLPRFFTPNYYGSKGFVSGWGATDDKQKHNEQLTGISVSIRENSQCNYMDYPATIGYKICSYGRVICEGDQGAPLLVGDVLVGIASASSNAMQCVNDKNGMFTNVNYYTAWIRRTTNNAVKPY